VTFALARSSHPAHAATTSATGAGRPAAVSSGFGAGQIYPASPSQAPSVSTGVS
jgi:hypothetical protein